MNLIELHAAARAECRAVRDDIRLRGPSAVPLRLFEICCAYEQVLSDLYLERPAALYLDRPAARGRHLHATARMFATLASTMLEHAVFTGDPEALLDVVACIEKEAVGLESRPLGSEGDEPADCHAKLPECFMRDLVDPAAYARFARKQVATLKPAAAVVIGIRTSGSYLAPIWDAALRSAGVDSVMLTARPTRNPRIDAAGRFVDPSPEDVWEPPAPDAGLLREFLAVHGRQRVTAIVMDDLAFTGSSFVRIDNYLTSIGVAGTDVVFVQNAPLIMNSLTQVAHARMSARRVLAAPKVPDGPVRLGDEAVRFFGRLLRTGHDSRTGNDTDTACRDVRVTSVDLAPPTFAQRHLAARTTVPVEQFVHFNPRGRDRHYVIGAEVDDRPTRLFAKILGVGVFAEHEFARIRRFADLAYRAVAHRGGFLFYEWIAGEPLGPDSSRLLDDEDLQRLAGYSATIGRVNPAGCVASDAYVDDVVGRLRRVVDLTGPLGGRLDSAGSLFRRAAAKEVPVVNAPRNQGHWHHVRDQDGRLRRVHLDLGEWSWRIDVAEEIASTIIELGLSTAQAADLVSRFVAQTGDSTVSMRMPLAAASYVARTLDSYRYWDGQVEQIPAKYRRAADDPLVVREEQRRRRMVDALHRALAAVEGIPS